MSILWVIVFLQKLFYAFSMISLRKSLRRWSVFLFPGLLGAFLLSCTVKTRDDLQSPDKAQAPLQTDIQEHSVKEDRSRFEDVRQEIPGDIKRENDELALVLSLMKDFKNSPSEVRSRFDRVMRRKRDDFNKKIRQEREDYTREERLKRDSYLSLASEQKEQLRDKSLDRDRKEFLSRKYRDERDRFFNDAREQRQDKENQWRERHRDFESYLREKRTEFEDELRGYTQQYYEYESNLRLKAKMDAKSENMQQEDAAADINEFDLIYSKPATPLKTDE